MVASEQDVERYIATSAREASLEGIISREGRPISTTSKPTSSRKYIESLKIGEALGNPTRLGILFTIYNGRKVSFSDLISISNPDVGMLNPGSFKHHMDILTKDGFIIKRGAYRLSEKGIKIVGPIEENLGKSDDYLEYLKIVAKKIGKNMREI